MRSQTHAVGRAVAALILTTTLAGCATAQWGHPPSQASQGNRYSLLPPSDEATNASSIPDDILFNPRLVRSLYGRSELYFEHPKIDAFVNEYETRSRGFFERALGRAAKYVPRMAAILKEEGLPPELAYLPLIESGFNNRAVSHAGAVGPWQFIRATGKRYGLRIDQYVDERRDPDKATRAAAQYLRDLYEMFGDWHLSLAAYNTGEHRVARTMTRQGADSYWTLMENRNLHPETCDYVPRFLAALTIAESPEAHGFEPPELDPVHYDMVAVDRSVSLRTIAQFVGASETEVRDLNPALLRGVTPPAGYQVRVPPGTRQRFEVAYAGMRRDARDAQALPAAVASASGGKYRVRRGDTIGGIAKRHRVSARVLMSANGLRNPKLLRIGQTLRLPGRAAAAKVVASARGAAPAASTYRVRKGDTIGRIAQRLGVGQRALMQANGIRNPRALKIGTKLRVPAKGQKKAAPVRVARAKR